VTFLKKVRSCDLRRDKKKAKRIPGKSEEGKGQGRHSESILKSERKDQKGPTHA
jgi:hypothetical protein